MNTYYDQVDQLLRTTPCLGRGQAHMVILKKLNPCLHGFILGSSYDPSRNDRRLTSYLEKITQMWSGRDHYDYGGDDWDDEEITINLDLSWPFL